MMSSRDLVLGRVRAALTGSAPAVDVDRDYAHTHTPDDPDTAVDLLARNLAEYRATVHRCAEADLPALVAGVLAEHGADSVVVPSGLPPAWMAGAPVRQLADHPPLTPGTLDAIDAVVTGCALAIAETGTLVLDGGAGQGRRALTLVPDLHVCVVRHPTQVVASVPQAVSRLDPTRPLTWISGPSATSDIELQRVEGVHGPRYLHVVIVG